MSCEVLFLVQTICYMHSENIFMKGILSKAHGLYGPFPFLRSLAPQTPSPFLSNVTFLAET